MQPTHILFLLDSVELKLLGRNRVWDGGKFLVSLPGIHFNRVLFFLEEGVP